MHSMRMGRSPEPTENTEQLDNNIDVRITVQVKAERADNNIETNRLKLAKSLARQERRTFQQLEQTHGEKAAKPLMESLHARFGKPRDIRDPEMLRGHQFQMRQLEKMAEAGTEWGTIPHGKMYGKEPYLYMNGSDGYTYAKTPNAPLQKLNPTTGQWDRVANMPGGFDQKAFNIKYAKIQKKMDPKLLEQYNANNTLEEKFLKPGFDKNAVGKGMSWEQFSQKYGDSAMTNTMNKQVAQRFNLLKKLGASSIPTVDPEYLKNIGLNDNEIKIKVLPAEPDSKEKEPRIQNQDELVKYLEKKLKEFEEAFKNFKSKESDEGSEDTESNEEDEEEKNDYEKIPKETRELIKDAVRKRVEGNEKEAKKSETSIEDYLEELENSENARAMLDLIKKYVKEATNKEVELKELGFDEGDDPDELDIDIKIEILDETFDASDANWDVEKIEPEEKDDNENSLDPNKKKSKESNNKKNDDTEKNVHSRYAKVLESIDNNKIEKLYKKVLETNKFNKWIQIGDMAYAIDKETGEFYDSETGFNHFMTKWVGAGGHMNRWTNNGWESKLFASGMPDIEW